MPYVPHKQTQTTVSGPANNVEDAEISSANADAPGEFVRVFFSEHVAAVFVVRDFSSCLG